MAPSPRSCAGMYSRTYTAPRALRIGSSDGAMPAGRTSGLNGMSVGRSRVVAFYVIEHQRARVDLLAVGGPGNRGVMRGSPGCPTTRINRHRSGCLWMSAMSPWKR